MPRSSARRATAIRRAIALMESIPFIDGHNDLPWVIRNDPIARGDVVAYDLARVHQDGDTDIPRLRAGHVGAQVWAAFIPGDTDHWCRAEPNDCVTRFPGSVARGASSAYRSQSVLEIDGPPGNARQGGQA